MGGLSGYRWLAGLQVVRRRRAETTSRVGRDLAPAQEKRTPDRGWGRATQQPFLSFGSRPLPEEEHRDGTEPRKKSRNERWNEGSSVSLERLLIPPAPNHRAAVD